MLVHALYYAFDEEEFFAADGGLGNLVASLVDEDLLSCLWQLTARPEQMLTHLLLQDVLTNRPFVVVYQQGIPVHQLERISERYSALDSLLREKMRSVESIQGEREVERKRALLQSTVQDFLTALRSPLPLFMADGQAVTAEAVVPEGAEQLFWLQNLCGRDFRKRFRLERLLWHKLLKEGSPERREVIAGAIDRVKAGIMREYFPSTGVEAIAAEEQRREAVQVARAVESALDRRLRDRPLVLLSLSWIPSWKSEDLLAHSRGFGTSDVRLHDAGVPLAERPALAFRDRDMDYDVLVSAPGAFVEDRKVKDAIVECFLELLDEGAWLWARHWD